MVFSVSITTGNNTLKVNSTKTVLKVAKGLVYRLEVEFPPGCSGLLHCQIFDGNYQVYPSSQQDSFHSDARVIGFDDLYLKTAAPFEFVVKTWNLDEINAHKVQVRIGIASSEAFMSRYMPSISWEKFQVVLAQAAADQELIKSRAIAEFQETFREE